MSLALSVSIGLSLFLRAFTLLGDLVLISPHTGVSLSPNVAPIVFTSVTGLSGWKDTVAGTEENVTFCGLSVKQLSLLFWVECKALKSGKASMGVSASVRVVS